jgi:hypothetical protein
MANNLETSFFPHRLNRDGSYDSLCLKCFMTIANKKTSAELDEHDRNHVCDESSLKSALLSRLRTLLFSVSSFKFTP